MTVDKLLERVVAAHDPTGVWDKIDILKVKLRLSGKILMTKFKCPTVRELDIEVSTERPWIKINKFPDSESYGIVEAYDVKIFTKEQERTRTINYPYKHKFLWDDLDLLYFFGYALWNYVNTPFIFRWPSIKIDQVEMRNGGYSLRAEFPKDIPTHCRHQTFYFNSQFLQTRLDYTAEVFWGGARGRHYCEKFKNYNELVVASHRYVYPFNLNFFTVMEGWVDEVNYSLKK